MPVVHSEQFRRRHHGVHADAREVVAIEVDVERAERLLDAEQRMQPAGHPHAAGMHADHERGLSTAGRQARFELVGQALDEGIHVHRIVHGRAP